MATAKKQCILVNFNLLFLNHLHIIFTYSKKKKRYHKQFYHGISSVSGKEFVQPLETRWVDQDLVEGLCHQCHQWVAVSNVKRKNSVLWYRHAHKVRSLLLQEKDYLIHTLNYSAIFIISQSPTYQKNDRSNISTCKKKKTPISPFISLLSSPKNHPYTPM